MRYDRLVIVSLGLLGLAGCGGGDTAGQGGSARSEGSRPAWLLAAAPDGATEIGATKGAAAEGDRVVVRGVIGGRLDPMTKGGAVFVMMDRAVPSCADMEDDPCATPWDYCCETDETIRSGSATVRLVEQGEPSVDLATYGFAPLDEVIVVGTVGPRPSPDVLVIEATGLYRAGG